MTIAFAFMVKSRLTIQARQPQTMKIMSAVNRQSPVINTQEHKEHDMPNQWMLKRMTMKSGRVHLHKLSSA
jgi:hypothetical protein